MEKMDRKKTGLTGAVFIGDRSGFVSPINSRTEKTMKTKKIGYTSVLFLAIIGASLLHAGTGPFDRTVQPVLEAYLKIHEALADDKTDGVKSAAEKIAVLSDNLDPGKVTGKHATHYEDLPAKIKTAALKLAQGKKIGPLREAFKALSRPMAMWATMSKPEGIFIVYCPMAKASWLQTDDDIRNPYHGHEMLRCGEIVGGQPHDEDSHRHVKGR
jgi:Cu(I)/Ag(I) efflux system membrane fusion protein